MISEQFFGMNEHIFSPGSLHVERIKFEDRVLGNQFLSLEPFLKALLASIYDIGKFFFVKRGFLAFRLKHELFVIIS
jgi:hypothetical protein